MGSKNRINLGFLIDFILHFHRNFYLKRKIYMSKRVQMKIKEKHPEVRKYTELQTFQLLMQETIAYAHYDKCYDTINFIAYIESKFVVYALKREKNHISCNTIYVLNRKTLKKLFRQENFKMIRNRYIELIESKITN